MWKLALLSCLTWCALIWTPTSARAEDKPATQPAVPHVLIVSIDGLRPDCALRADMPHLRALMIRGSFSFWANTTDVAITLPSHMSMLTGVPPEKHRVTWNTDEPHPQQPWPAVPTLFEIAKQAGHTTAVVAGKSKFNIFQKPGVLNWDSVKEQSDDEVASAAADIIRQHQPEVMFVHFPDCDRSGHKDGWGTPQQIATIGKADVALGRVLDAIHDVGLTDSTLVILSADHGGAGLSHGAGDPRSRHIPWIAAGPNVRHDYDLTHNPRLVIHTEDTFATACDALHIPIPSYADGKPVKDIYAERGELLQAAP